jgi:hypothetical protein
VIVQSNSTNKFSLEESKDIFTNQFSKLFERKKDQIRITRVVKVDNPSKNVFINSIEPAGYPVVFSSVNGFNDIKSQYMQTLVSKHASLDLTVRIGDYANPENYVSSRRTQVMQLSNYLSFLENHTDDLSLMYAGNIRPPSSLLSDLNCECPKFYAQDKFELPNMWIGGPGAITPLHKDGSDNFAVHLFGTKRWKLFPVRDIPFLHMHRILFNSDFAVSAIDMRYPDTERFPELNETQCLEVDVKGGETLYLPEGWGHYVENLETTLMINYWIRENQKIE